MYEFSKNLHRKTFFGNPQVPELILFARIENTFSIDTEITIVLYKMHQILSTGLDPSASQWGSNSHRLRASDARYVEVIHTDGDGLGANGLGTALGHVDFFANGGGNQPGCVLHSCNHNRAWQLFAATLTHSHLIGNLCETNLQLSLNRCRGYALAVGNNNLGKYG